MNSKLYKIQSDFFVEKTIRPLNNEKISPKAIPLHQANESLKGPFMIY